MKGKHLCKAEQPSSSDVISTFPQTVLETILCLLPTTKEAVRTSILAREWRYKWTKIPKLKFYLSQLSKEKQALGRNNDMIRKLFYELHKILLLHQGPIHEFTLHIDLELHSWKKDPCSFGLDQTILLLSKNHTVKKLRLTGYDFTSCFSLPISVFSLHHLTDMDLCCVDLDHPPIFNVFYSLRSLSLRDVGISTKTLLHLLSNCPSLKSLNLFIGESDPVAKDCTIVELFECLPVIEHLTIHTDVFKRLVLDSVPEELPNSLFQLKYFCFECVCFRDGYGLAFLLVLMKCCLILEKIKLEIEWGHECDQDYSVVWEEYSDVWLEHLIELEIEFFRNSEPEMELVKFILDRSPKLKKLKIYSIIYENPGLEFEMLKTLLQAPRASPVIITVENLLPVEIV